MRRAVGNAVVAVTIGVVKVGGYSPYFVELGHEVQNELIARTKHGPA